MSKPDGWMVNSADPDQMSRSEAADLGLRCLLKHVCPNIQGKYCILYTCYLQLQGG